MDQITIKTLKPKDRLFLKSDLSRDLAAGVYLSEAHFLLLHTLSINTPVLNHTGKGEKVNQREGERGASSQEGSKIPT
jgi:hypothetical protein